MTITEEIPQKPLTFVEKWFICENAPEFIAVTLMCIGLMTCFVKALDIVTFCISWVMA